MSRICYKKATFIVKATEKKHLLYSKWLPRLRLVAAFLMLFYVLADVSVIEYFSGNAALGIPAYNKVVVLDSAPLPSANAGIKKIQNSFNESHFKRTHQSESSSDDDDCFLCCTHMILGCNQMDVPASDLPVVAQKSPAAFSREQRRSDSHLPTFYRPPRII